MTDEEFKIWLARQDKPKDYAAESHKYGNPANHVKFQREKGEYMDQIKGLLNIWAGYYKDRYGTGYPKQSAFVTERVQTSNRSTETFREIPAEVEKLNDFIEGNKEKGIPGLAPLFKTILHLEYMDSRPQKTKAAVLSIPREVFSVRLRFCHEQLNFAMWGK